MKPIFLPDGTPFDEATSSLQKHIRRCNPEEAVSFALRLQTKYHHYVWKRLMIIACEDIGMADPDIAADVIITASQMRGMSNISSVPPYPGKPTMSEMMLAQAVRKAACAKKSRDANNVIYYVMKEMRANNITPKTSQASKPQEFDDALAEMITLMRQQEEVQAVAEALHLNGHYAGWLWDALCIIALGHGTPKMVQTLAGLRDLVFDGVKQKDPGYEWNMLGFAMLWLIRDCDWSTLTPEFKTYGNAIGDYRSCKAPDYALDRHTNRGKALGRDFHHFVTEAAHINNAVPEKYNVYAPGKLKGHLNDTEVYAISSEYKVGTGGQQPLPIEQMAMFGT